MILTPLLNLISSYNYLKVSIVFISIVVIGYFIGKLVSFILKIILNKILGFDSWLHSRGIAQEYSITNIILSIIRFFIYFYFIGYAFKILPYNISIIGILLLSVLNYLLIIILSMIIAFIMLEMIIKTSIEPILNNIKYKSEMMTLLRFITMFFVLVLLLSYLNLLSPILLYLFIILFSGMIIPISIALGIALGDLFKEKIKDLKK
ncbi:hypothetical protein MJ1_0501 [Nanobdella aerobiophila]|uniref:Uncharacterized protein n=1 Tax=Nanobdella aerobiophila TaxID=2586965 RepID=A0A915WRV8_9ARCH|nr:hypothetical protein [Nanobdella aerobiophila]BBL45654.1 hypothetical protein MJ1_0501 [Nanobdella aerobiophila]